MTGWPRSTCPATGSRPWGLADAPLLQELQLGANPLTDLRPLLRATSLVDLGLDETDRTRLTGIEELRAAGVPVDGLARTRPTGRPASPHRTWQWSHRRAPGRHTVVAGA